jgi:UDP-glucuronate 4-epimerase
VQFVQHDFADVTAMGALLRQHAVGRIVHLGALPGVSPSVRDPLAYQQTNVGGTLALLEAARQAPIGRFLLVSSSTVYGKGAPAPFREDGPLGVPASPYGATKRAAELLGLTYHQLHGLGVVCLRPFSVYGPRLRPDLALARFAAALWRGEPITLFGDGSALRDFTYVDDICAGLLAALERPGIEGQAINLGCGRPIEMRAVIAALEHALGRRAEVRRAAPRPEDLELTFADIGTARRLLGYEPSGSSGNRTAGRSGAALPGPPARRRLPGRMQPPSIGSRDVANPPAVSCPPAMPDRPRKPEAPDEPAAAKWNAS